MLKIIFKDGICSGKKSIVNIETIANLLECLELAKGECFWLLGEDENHSADKIFGLYASLAKQDIY